VTGPPPPRPRRLAVRDSRGRGVPRHRLRRSRARPAPRRACVRGSRHGV